MTDKAPLAPFDRRHFIGCNQIHLPNGKPVGGELVFEDAIAQVFDLDSYNTDISRFWP
jgi:hypothetical protein